ncbi:DNA primase [Calditrichota bacterium GD2]
MGKINPLKIDEIRGAVNIVHYISRFVSLKKAGQNYKGLCPFHTEKTPSFVVSPAKQIFHCFGCGKGGNIYTFIMEYEKLSFFEALRRAAEFAGIPLPEEDLEAKTRERTYFEKLYEINETAARYFEDNLFKREFKNWLDYFKKRGLSERTIKKFQLGYAPDSKSGLLEVFKKKNVDLAEAEKLGLVARSFYNDAFIDKFRHRVMFPFHNLSGKIIGFGGRQLRSDQQPKYLNSPESPIYKKGSILYGLYQAINRIREEDLVILVEGYFDLLQLVEHGQTNVVATSGTALTDYQARLIGRYTQKVLLLYDGDDAGRKAALRNGYILEKNGLNAFIAALPADEDPDSFLRKNGLKALEPYLKSQLTPVEFEINMFYEENPKPSLQAKNQFVSQLLENLLELNDPLKTGLYLPLVSDLLQINEDLLVEQFKKLERQRRRWKKAETVSPEIPTETEDRVHRGQYLAEAGVVYLLLNGEERVRNFLLSQLSYDLFENPSFIEVYEAILNELDEVGKVDKSEILSQFQEAVDVQAALSALDLMEFNDPLKFARDCIFQLKKWTLEKQAQEIQELIRSDHESQDALAHYTVELMRVRKELNRLVKDHRAGSGDF